MYFDVTFGIFLSLKRLFVPRTVPKNFWVRNSTLTVTVLLLHLVFFKAPDAEAFHSAFKEYSASLLNKDKRPSVLAKLHELVQAAAELPGKVRHKEQERGL